MNDKEWVEDKIDKAYEILNKSLLTHEGKIDKKYRSAFSSFGAAVIMGTDRSAISGFWSANSETNKDTVVACIYELLSGITIDPKKNKCSSQEIVKYFEDAKFSKDELLNAAAAFKMACDLFERIEK